MDSLWLLIPKGKPVPPIIRWIVVGLVPCLAVKSGVGNGGNNDRVLPSARVTCSLYAQYMAKSNGKSLPTFIAVSTLYKCIPPTPHRPRFYRISQKSHLPFIPTFPDFLSNTSVSRFAPQPPTICRSQSSQSVAG